MSRFTETMYSNAQWSLKGMVTGLTLKPGTYAYGVTWPSGAETIHYEFELSIEFTPDFSAEMNQ